MLSRSKRSHVIKVQPFSCFQGPSILMLSRSKRSHVIKVQAFSCYQGLSVLMLSRFKRSHVINQKSFFSYQLDKLSVFKGHCDFDLKSSIYVGVITWSWPTSLPSYQLDKLYHGRMDMFKPKYPQFLESGHNNT